MAILKGLSFPLRIGPRGSFIESTGIDKIKDNIKAIILTSMGERVMSPNVGSLGYLYLFKSIDSQSGQELQNYIRTGVELSESRVSVISVDLTPTDKGKLLINMTFKIDTGTEYHDLSLIVEE
jgi:uncharacterized protein